MPVIAVMILFYAVRHWNSWFHAMIFLSDRGLYPLQIILREILIANSTDSMMPERRGIDRQGADRRDDQVRHDHRGDAADPADLPFLQKYFVKGVMIGAIKG